MTEPLPKKIEQVPIAPEAEEGAQASAVSALGIFVSSASLRNDSANQPSQTRLQITA
jgi:hypothetical protein